MKDRYHMIIGQFSEAFPPINDGVAQVVKNYAYWLNKKGDECHVITTKVPHAIDDYNFDIHRYNSFNILFKKQYRTGFPKLDRRFCKELTKIDFDIVHSHSPFSAGTLGLSIAKKLNIPSVITFHSKFKTDFKQIMKSDLIADLMLKKIMPYFNKADDVWTVSESAVDTLREYGYKGDIFVVENASDFPSQERNKKSNMIIKKKYNLPMDIVQFAFVGQIIYQKNIKLIIEALRIIHNKGLDFRMLFVGEGKIHDFQRQITSYGFKHKVVFTGNIHDRQHLKDMYLSSRFITFPSLYDVSSLVIKEAAAMHCPMILIENSTTSQGVIDSKNGFLIKNDANSLAEKIELLINDKELARTVGDEANKTLYRSWEQSIEKARIRYLYLIDKKGR